MKRSEKSVTKNPTTNHLLSVRVTAGAKRESITKGPKRWHICVREPAEQNRANERVCALIAREKHVPVGAVRLVSGHHAPSKRIAVYQRQP